MCEKNILELLNFFYICINKFYNMKKALILLGFVIVLAFTVSSCKSSGSCPAYGQVDTEQANPNV